MRPIVTFLSTLCFLVVLAFLVGRVVSDRFAWSQWLLWIPAPVPVMAGACLLAAAPAAQGWRRRGRTIAGVLAVGLGVGSLLGQHRPWRAAPVLDDASGVVRVAHWNPQWVVVREMRDVSPMVLSLDADVTVVTNAGALRRREVVGEWEAAGYTVAYANPFIALSRLPILEARTIVADDGAYAMVLRIDASERLGRELVILAMDMPSDPRVGRMDLAQRVRRWLDERDAPEPDIVLGDFNMTRDSAAMRALLPGMRHAFDDAGRGVGASYPSAFPLWHIDHMLLGPDVRAIDYALRPMGGHAHLAQSLVIGH